MNGFHKYDLSAFAVRYGTQSHFLFNVIGAMKLESGMWIAGGAVRDFVRDCPIDSDVDVFR